MIKRNTFSKTNSVSQSTDFIKMFNQNHSNLIDEILSNYYQNIESSKGIHDNM
jgi:hypothetical protein